MAAPTPIPAFAEVERPVVDEEEEAEEEDEDGVVSTGDLVVAADEVGWEE